MYSIRDKEWNKGSWEWKGDVHNKILMLRIVSAIQGVQDSSAWCSPKFYVGVTRHLELPSTQNMNLIDLNTRAFCPGTQSESPGPYSPISVSASSPVAALPFPSAVPPPSRTAPSRDAIVAFLSAISAARRWKHAFNATGSAFCWMTFVCSD